MVYGLIPERRGGENLVDDFALSDYLTEVVILPDSTSVGKEIRNAPLVHDLDLVILKIQRGEENIQLPSPDEILQADDVLLIQCDLEKIRSLQEREGVLFRPQTRWGDENVVLDDFRLLEAVIEPNSNLIAGTLQSTQFRDRFGANVLAIRHGGSVVYQKLSEKVLRGGDVLLMEVDRNRIPAIRKSGEFIITSEMETTAFRRRQGDICRRDRCRSCDRRDARPGPDRRHIACRVGRDGAIGMHFA